MYGRGLREEEERSWKRGEQVEMARFRSGHSMELRGHQKRIGRTEEGSCRRCEEEDETLDHVMRCVAGEAKRWQLELEGLEGLAAKPKAALDYWGWWRRRRV